MLSAPAVWKVPMMWLEGSWRMAAPQSAKRGLRRVKGAVLVRQWAKLLKEGNGTGTVAGGVDVRFTGWWMGERSDVGGMPRETAVETSAVSERSTRHDTLNIVHALCLRTMLICSGRKYQVGGN